MTRNTNSFIIKTWYDNQLKVFVIAVYDNDNEIRRELAQSVFAMRYIESDLKYEYGI